MTRRLAAAAILIVLTGCANASSPSGQQHQARPAATTTAATATATTTTRPTPSTRTSVTPAPVFCAGVATELGASGWPKYGREVSGKYDDLDLRRLRSCGLHDGDLWIDWTLNPADDTDQADHLSSELFAVASLAKSAGEFRDAHFQAYLPFDGVGPPSVLQVADVEFTKGAIDRVSPEDYDPKLGFWHRADVSQNIDGVLIGEVDR